MFLRRAPLRVGRAPAFCAVAAVFSLLATVAPAQGKKKPAEKPSQVFTSHPRAMPREYHVLTGRFDANKDWWATELVAELAQESLERELTALLRGGDADAWKRLLADSFAGSTLLRPDALVVVHDDGALRIRRSAEIAPETLPAADLGEQLAALVRPLAGSVDARVSVTVVAVSETAPARFESNLRLQLAGTSSSAGAGTVQINVDLGVDWLLSDNGSRALVERIHLEQFEEVEFFQAPFAELTRHVLEDDPFFDRAIHLGSVQYEQRVDSIADSGRVYLGMNGMAVGDVDGDGLEDLYVGLQGGVPNRLLLQQPDGTARDGAAEAGVDFLDDTAGVLILDVDGDGHRDLVFGRDADVVLAWNDGSGRFPEVEVLPGDGSERVFSISAADPDGDEDLDLFVARYVKRGAEGGAPQPYHDASNGAPNMFWRNDESGFTLATKEVGLDVENTRFSLASIWEDFDGDGDLDLYVTNDFGRNNLFENEGGHFTDVADDAGVTDMAASMGVTCSDVDLDGHLDMYVSNMFTAPGRRVTRNPVFLESEEAPLRASYARHTRGNTLLVGRGDGTFEDATERFGAAVGGWAWGAMFADFDNDARADLYVPNGFLTGRLQEDVEGFSWRSVIPECLSPEEEAYPSSWEVASHLVMAESHSWNGWERNFAYWNTSAGFVDVSAAAGVDYLDDGRVACVVDWDGDGRLDLWLKNRTAPLVRFVHNRHATAASWIAFELEAEGPNREAIGALVTVETDGRTFRRRSYAGEGFLGGSSRRLHFGLADATRAERVTVRWPDGTEEHHENVDAGRVWKLRRGQSEPMPIERPDPPDLGTVTATRLPGGVPELRDPTFARSIGLDATCRLARVPLLDRLPFKALELPEYQRDVRAIGDFAGSPLCVVLWGSWDDASLALLGDLAAAREDFAADGIVVYPISMDKERDVARAAIRPFDLERKGGRMGRRAKVLFELALWEVLGPFEDHPLPAVFLFDAEGALACLYLGRANPEEVRADARLLAHPNGLTGGRWIEKGPVRDFDSLYEILKKQGYRDLARELKAEGERRAGDEAR